MVVTWTYNSGSNRATAAGAGTTNFAELVAADTAGGWGKFSADTTGTQIICKGKLCIGDGINAITFSDINKQVFIHSDAVSANSQTFITANKSTIQFNDCDFKYGGATYSLNMFDTTATGSTINCTNCQFISLTSGVATAMRFRATQGGVLVLTDCFFSNCMIYNSYNTINPTYTITNMRIINTNYGLRTQSSPGTLTNLSIQGAAIAVYLEGSSSDVTITNLIGSGNTTIAGTNTSSGNLYLVNPVVDSWTMNLWASPAFVVYRQYTFDLTTEPGATVTLKKADGNTVFSMTANATTGVIASQTVSRGYYDQAHGNTMQDYGPFTLTITKTGKMPYIQTGIVLSSKINWLIALRNQLSGTAAASDVAAGTTFYKDDADSKLTGTLALTGDAAAGDVLNGKKFYKNDPKTQLTGSYVNPAVFVDVASGKPVLNLNNKKLDNRLVLGL